MKFASLIAVAAILSLVAIPAMAEMTDYQKGVNDGLANGLRIGYLLGGAPYDTNANQQYNGMVNPFNSWLQAVFGANQTEINLFWMKTLSGQTMVGGYQAYPVVNSTKPVHSIDGSWNQSTAVYHADEKGKIYGYDPDTYYTMVGWNNAPATPGAANGGSLQPP
jgi:hypothetical protein